MPQTLPERPVIPDLSAFDTIIDVRSPAEFAEDHIPGAINCPVLDNEQRIEVGTLHKQVSPFEARKVGAAHVSRNIALHLEQQFRDCPKDWKPLVYCWRGGNRSGSMTTVFRAIGWKTVQLEGGYKTWRNHVIAGLSTLPPRFEFAVVCGPTGSGKTCILQAIGALGEQVLDLETLACHKGSVLGILPGQPQPSQKSFETALYQTLAGFDPARPVYVEAESRKIGRLHVPETLIERIRLGRCLAIDATLPARVDFLIDDYAYFLNTPALLCERLERLHEHLGRETLKRWQGLIANKDWPALVRELLELHYDRLYGRSQEHHFAGSAQSLAFATDNLTSAGIADLAKEIVRAVQSRTAQIA